MSDDTNATLKGDDEVIADAKSYYDLVIAFDQENRTEALADKEFLRGDQWDVNARRLREIEQRPCLTVNVLPSFIQQVINDQRQNKSNIKTHPVEDADEEVNEVAQGLIKHIEYASNADVAYDRALGSATEIGFGYWRLITDYCNEKSFDQDIKFSSIRNPFSVYFDPLSTEPDGSDQRKCLISIDQPRAEFEKEYPKASTLGAEWLTGTGNNKNDDWITKDSIRVAEFYRIEETEADLYQLPDGQTAWADDLQAMGLPEEARKVLKTRKSKKRKVMLYKLTGAEVLERTEIKCRWIPVFPVWGTEIDINGKVYRQGMIRTAKDPARMYNVLVTAATEEVASRSKAPWVGAEGQFEGHEKKWRQANTRNFPYLEYKPTTVEGQLAPPPQRQPMADVPAGFLTMAGHARDDIKATTGIFDASLGAAGNEASGKAIVARQRQGDVANFHYQDNLVRTQRHCGRCIIEMIPYYYDATRLVRIMGEDGSIKSTTINQPQVAENGAEMLLNNLTVGQYDVTVESGPAYSTQRQEAADAMVQLAQGNPQIMQVAGDLVVKSLDFKGADEIAERLKLAMPPEIRNAANDEQDPQVAIVTAQAQQAIDQLQQQIQAAEQGIAQRDAELKRLQQEKEDAEHKLMIEGYKAKTERLKALAPAMPAEQVQALVIETLQALMAQPEPIQAEQEMAIESMEPPPNQMEMPPQEMQEQPPQGGFFTPEEAPPQQGY